MSLRDITNYKSGEFNINPYQGLLKDKENLKYKFGTAKLYPNPSEYSKFKNICD
jgi:hypothetical protein